MEHKFCDNCGAMMMWDFINSRWICNCCGNAEHLNKDWRNFKHGYIG